MTDVAVESSEITIRTYHSLKTPKTIQRNWRTEILKQQDDRGNTASKCT